MNEREQKYVLIAQRAIDEKIYDGNKLKLLMDIESADVIFHLRLDEWLDANELDFAHDLLGIVNNIRRGRFPAVNFGSFVPRFSNQIYAR